MCRVLFAVLFVCGIAMCHASGQTDEDGKCPIVEPMQGFEMSKFLGEWYVIQMALPTVLACPKFNFTLGKEQGEYLTIMGEVLINKYHHVGTLRTISKETPAKMSIEYPTNRNGSGVFTVFMTDYDSYAGVYGCKMLPATEKRMLSGGFILSRTLNLEKEIVDKIRSRLSKDGVNTDDMVTKCPCSFNTKCPTVEPMQGFDMSKFLGVWYVMQNRWGKRCLRYNFALGKEPGEYLTQKWGVQPINFTLRAISKETPANMTIEFAPHINGSGIFTVFMTDYDSYAGAYNCEWCLTTDIVVYQITILSRTPILEEEAIDKIRALSSHSGFRTDCLKTVDHTNCHVGDQVDADNFRAANIAAGVRKAD